MALAREVQALLSVPFLVFLLPMALPLLTGCTCVTGYDKRGLLCQALSRTQIRLVREERRARARSKKFSLAPDGLGPDGLGAQNGSGGHQQEMARPLQNAISANQEQ